MNSKLALKNSEADKLAKEQSKNKLLSLCMENGRKFKYRAPVSSQDDVNKMYNSLQKLDENDQLSVMRREAKLKKTMFSEMPTDFILFKQYNISAKQMYQNLLALHSVDSSHQEVVSVEDIYAVTESLDSLSMQNPTKKRSALAPERRAPTGDVQWPPQEEDFVITLDEGGWGLGSVQSYDPDQDSIQVQLLQTLKTRAKDDKGKTYWVYPDEENVDQFQQKHVLDIREIVEAMCCQIFEQA